MLIKLVFLTARLLVDLLLVTVIEEVSDVDGFLVGGIAAHFFFVFNNNKELIRKHV